VALATGRRNGTNEHQLMLLLHPIIDDCPNALTVFNGAIHPTTPTYGQTKRQPRLSDVHMRQRRMYLLD
jgi:hypothetical protein